MEKYTISLNSDRVHLCLDNVPVETHLYSQHCDKSAGEDENFEGKHTAIGFLVCKALTFADSKSIEITDKSK